MLTIDKVDDVQEMRDTKQAFDVLMFTQVKINILAYGLSSSMFMMLLKKILRLIF